jgi:GR25 family glycosyltransferase involved in LPS biosynthesis
MDLVFYIICCNEEREEFMRKQMIDLKITYPIVYFKAFTPENSQDWVTKDDEEFNHNEKLQCSCRSHIEALKDFKKHRPEEFLLILEDDVCLLKENFESKLNKCVDFYSKNYHIVDFLTLGYIPTDFGMNPNNKYFPLCKKKEFIYYELKFIKDSVWGAQAQLFSKKKIDTILEVFDKKTGKEVLESVKTFYKTFGWYQSKAIYLTFDSILPSIFSQGIVESHLAVEKNYGVNTSIHRLQSTMQNRKNSWIIGHNAEMYTITEFYSYE